MIIVGEAPGYREEETGRLFSGNAGQLLDKLLRELELNREWFFVTNAVKCRPENNRTPTASEIKTCVSSYLIDELAAIKPKFGLLLGNGACQAILGKKGITNLNGQIIERHGITWVPAFHPAAVLRNPRYLQPLQSALLVFSRLIRDADGIPVTNAILVDTKDRLKELIAVLETAEIAAVDCETWSPHPKVGRFKGGGLAWWDPEWKLVSLEIATEWGTGYTVPLWHERSPWKDPQAVVNILKPYIEALPARVMHNGKYDMKCLWNVGIDAPYTFDTMGAWYAMDENNTKDLGFLSRVYLNAQDYKGMVDKSAMYYEPLVEINEYGARDADYTLRLETVGARRLGADQISDRLFRTLLMRADRTLAAVEYRGMPLDNDRLVERTAQCVEKRNETEAEVFDLTGWEFNVNSTAQLGDVLFNHLELPILEFTATGKPSTREGVLIRLQDLDDSGLMEKIMEYRKWQGYLSRYFGPYPRLVGPSGRIHPHFKPFHTVTGRLSCEHPNLQQVPRDNFVRGLFGGLAGWRILEADYSQVEMRLAAHYSQDRTLLRIFNSGRDVHMEMAMHITGLAESQVTPEQRKLAKAVNFGFLYGMGYNKFITYAKENYGVDVSEGQAKQQRKEYFQQYSSLQGWHNRQRLKAEQKGYVMSAIGRKRHLWDVNSTNDMIRDEAMRQAINAPVQSLASDMMLMAMNIIEETFPADEIHALCTVHDSILFAVQEDLVDKWAPEVKAVMEDLPLEKEFDCILTVPIVADLKVGTHWSEGATAL